jgi:hypothetical protein
LARFHLLVQHLIALFDGSPVGSSNLLWFGTLQTARSFIAGDSLVIGAGALSITLVWKMETKIVGAALLFLLLFAMMVALFALGKWKFACLLSTGSKEAMLFHPFPALPPLSSGSTTFGRYLYLTTSTNSWSHSGHSYLRLSQPGSSGSIRASHIRVPHLGHSGRITSRLDAMKWDVRMTTAHLAPQKFKLTPTPPHKKPWSRRRNRTPRISKGAVRGAHRRTPTDPARTAARYIGHIR